MTTTVHKLAQTFVERAYALGLKGKRRDELALEFFMGAYALVQATGDKVLEERIALVAFVVAARGFSFVRETAEKGGRS